MIKAKTNQARFPLLLGTRKCHGRETEKRSGKMAIVLEDLHYLYISKGLLLYLIKLF